jgi:hypothetical protein
MALCGCGPDELGRNSNSNSNSTGHGGHDLAGDLSGDLSAELDGGHPSMPDACVAVTAKANLGKLPADIIFIIDNSGSMGPKISAVENNLDVNFAQIIKQSNIDYRVILLSWYATADGGGNFRVCIRQPLGGNVSCDSTEPFPVDTATFYQYNDLIGSTNSLFEALKTYNARDPSCPLPPSMCSAPNGWSDWLRPEALKVFVEITDDQSNTNADDFETMLFALTPKMFGDATRRNYVFHSIIGVLENTPPIQPYQSTDPVVTMACSTAVNDGPQYQDLSIRTGGLRFPVCEYNSYDVVFRAIADGVVAGAKIACNFDVPTAPGGEGINLSTVVVQYTPSTGGQMQNFKQVSDASKCTDVNQFYINTSTDGGNGQIVLCPATCQIVQDDNAAQVSVTFDCSIM